MIKIPNAKIIKINFHYNDTPDNKRSELAYIEGDVDYDQESEEKIKVGELTVSDNELFYYFQSDEEIVKDHGEFTVSSFELVSSNPSKSPKP